MSQNLSSAAVVIGALRVIINDDNIRFREVVCKLDRFVKFIQFV